MLKKEILHESSRSKDLWKPDPIISPGEIQMDVLYHGRVDAVKQYFSGLRRFDIIKRHATYLQLNVSAPIDMT